MAVANLHHSPSVVAGPKFAPHSNCSELDVTERLIPTESIESETSRFNAIKNEVADIHALLPRSGSRVNGESSSWTTDIGFITRQSAPAGARAGRLRDFQIVELNSACLENTGRTQHSPIKLKTFAKLIFGSTAFLAITAISLPVRALDATQLAVIINSNDPISVQIGEYYAGQRRISFQNIIRIALPQDRTELTRQEFDAIKLVVDAKAMRTVQAFALTWLTPYRVECMSMTSAFAFGFDPALCEPGCKPTRPSPYFNSRSQRPFSHFGIRPTMAIAGTSFEQAKALIDRGIKADGTFPEGTAYLMSTSDSVRNVRSPLYPVTKRVFAESKIRAFILKRNELKYVDDVLFYFTGMTNVTGLETLKFVPGAIADHLTSSGGRLTDSNGQMSALRWLEAGATASYGTVVEPCNLPQKFPNPAVLAARYLKGDTLIEAYWKSVAMPGQGLFIGEPLAAPFRAKKID